MDTQEQTPEEKRDAALLASGTDPATGFATDGQWPHNHRLRAEAMAEAGVTTDPAGMISDELIADTKARLDRDAAVAEDEARNAPSMRWTRDELAAEAVRLKLELPSDATKQSLLDAINAAPAADQQEG